MEQIRSSAWIEGSPEQIFDIITTARYWPQWHPATIGVGGVTERPFVASDQVIERARIGDHVYEGTWTVVEHQRPSHATLRGSSGRITISYRLEPSAAGAQFQRELSYIPEDFRATSPDPAQLAQIMQQQSDLATSRLALLIEQLLGAYTPPFTSAISYAAQNEDYRSEQAIIDRLPPDRPLHVLMVASSGEGLLSLLTSERIARVDAVDLNPAQLQLCELRRAALERLTRDQQLQLLAARDTRPRASGADARIALYESLRPHLAPPSQAFWDARRAEIAFGLQHVGRNDMLMHDVTAHLRAAGFAPLHHAPADTDLPRWQQVYTDLMTPAYIQQIFGLPSLGLAARIAEIAGYLGECHLRALQRPGAAHNYFLTTVFGTGYAPGEDGLPLYLQEQGQSALRAHGTRERMHLHQGNIIEQIAPLAQAHGAFDLISISNIPDWMSDAQFADVVLLAREHLSPGGMLLSRTATGRPMIQDVTAQHLTVDPALQAALPAIERGPWFRTIAAGAR